ncbi:hypothetical protein [Bdellovibrio reynosensis]|uniref:AMIN domain-containing protein n=1 Tax=Bdellovibrio reynosensis TaxID=2835041 RepID=A0ABY4CC21_9BACT|nr:hypothetical protein [Bdellovibrio reynosensis]UOF01063.1 hypothetical protein MNR06_15285 [Bdellovibrio reynosensis]
MKYMGCVVSVALLWNSFSFAAVPAESKKATVSKVLSGQGISFGGLAGTGFTLLDLRRTSDTKKKVERVVIDVGDMNGAPLRGWPGYYFAELKKNPSRLVIDFAQMPNAHIDQGKIKNIMKNSLAVKTSTMSLDPVDSSLNLTLDLKQNTKVRVYQVAGKKQTSKVVVDFWVE